MSFRALREASGMTLEQAAKVSGYGVSTINGLEIHDEGSTRLRKKLTDIYAAASGNQPDSLRDGPPQETTLAQELALWQHRATQAEAELARLKSMLRELSKHGN